MVLLDQYPVIERHPMISTPRLRISPAFLQAPEGRRGLRASRMVTRPPLALHVAACHGRDAGEMLQEVQRRPLRAVSAARGPVTSAMSVLERIIAVTRRRLA